jgi:hypothetical protein
MLCSRSNELRRCLHSACSNWAGCTVLSNVCLYIYNVYQRYNEKCLNVKLVQLFSARWHCSWCLLLLPKYVKIGFTCFHNSGNMFDESDLVWSWQSQVTRYSLGGFEVDSLYAWPWRRQNLCDPMATRYRRYRRRLAEKLPRWHRHRHDPWMKRLRI